MEMNGGKKLIELDNIIYKNIDDNISIIKLKEKDNNIKYIEIDDKILENESEMNYDNESIYIIQYDNIDNILISYGVIKEINKNELIYTGNINSEFKFSPIFLFNNKLIGIHNNNENYLKKDIFKK